MIVIPWYVAPLLFIGTAIVLQHRRVNIAALATATAFGLYVVITTPYQMGVQLYSDALGLAILQQANRFLLWTPWFAQWLLIAVTLAGGVLLAVPRFLGDRQRTAGIVVATLGAGSHVCFSQPMSRESCHPRSVGHRQCTGS